MQKYALKVRLQLLLLFCFTSYSLLAQDCSIKNNSFQLGERIDYDIYYYLAGVWVPAGVVHFKVNSTTINNNDYYHYYGYGETLPKYDWFFKVRDTYESYANMETLQPIRFKRKVNEGSTHIREDYVFNTKKNKVYSLRQMDKDEPFVKDSVFYSGCSWDVLSIIYYARNLDFSKNKVGDKVPIKLFLDNEEHQSFIEYKGKEELEVKGLGTFNCYKFSPLLIEGTIFESGSGMTVWVTDDENNLPLLIETPILVGSIKVRLRSTENLRHEMKSKVK